MKAMQGNFTVKREMRKFMARFFANRERNIDNLALLYYYIEDIAQFVDSLQAEVGTELLKKNLDKVFLEDFNKKVFFDDELNFVLIDEISDREKAKLQKEANIKIRKEQERKAVEGGK